MLPDQPRATEVFRASIRELESGSLMAQNIELRDGDTIFVPRAETVYVFGQVKNPGAYAHAEGHDRAAGAVARRRRHRERRDEPRPDRPHRRGRQERDSRSSLTDIVKPGDTIIVPERYF